ncbi:MAG: dihydropyrimidinase [Chloroflexia bacterium]
MGELLIRNGTIVTPAGCYQADLLCCEGRIAAIGHFPEAPAGKEVLDARGCFVLPGGIDVHVHLQMSVGDMVTHDDFFSGTVAAACGGTTTVLDFATQARGQPLWEAVVLRRAEADGQVAIDYGLHLAVTDAAEETLRTIRELGAQGYTSLKLYTVYRALFLEDREILEILALCAEAGLVPMVHGENRALVEYCTERLRAQGKRAPQYHAQARPALAEAEGVARVLALAEGVGCPVYVAHVSSARVLEEIRRARDRGQTVFAETCPQYLLLSEELYTAAGFEGAKFVVTPPLRKQADVGALWKALARGEIDVVSTDHCPWNYRGQKDHGREDFSLIPSGMPGIETRLALLWSEGVGKGRLSPEQFVSLTAAMPARIFGMTPRKGSIAVGADADLLVWDPEQQRTLRAQELHQQVDYCPYEGWPVRGYPRVVVLRGEIIASEGRFVGKRGQGRFLPRTPRGETFRGCLSPG